MQDYSIHIPQETRFVCQSGTRAKQILCLSEWSLEGLHAYGKVLLQTLLVLDFLGLCVCFSEYVVMCGQKWFCSWSDIDRAIKCLLIHSRRSSHCRSYLWLSFYVLSVPLSGSLSISSAGSLYPSALSQHITVTPLWSHHSISLCLSSGAAATVSLSRLKHCAVLLAAVIQRALKVPFTATFIPPSPLQRPTSFSSPPPSCPSTGKCQNL